MGLRLLQHKLRVGEIDCSSVLSSVDLTVARTHQPVAQRLETPKWALPPPQARAKPGSRAWTPRSRQSCARSSWLEVQSKVSGQVIFVGRKNPLFAQPKRLAHNGLVGGSNPSSPTTQSDAKRRLPVSGEKPAVCGAFSRVQTWGMRSLPSAEVAIASILAFSLWALQTRSWRRGPELHVKNHVILPVGLKGPRSQFCFNNASPSGAHIRALRSRRATARFSGCDEFARMVDGAVQDENCRIVATLIAVVLPLLPQPAGVEKNIKDALAPSRDVPFVLLEMLGSDHHRPRLASD